MTYKEIKTRLAQCELTLEKLKNGNYEKSNVTDVKKTTANLELLKESLQKQLLEAQGSGTVFTDDESQAEKLAKKGVNVKITKEQEGAKFSIDETKAIAKAVGKAVGKALNSVGDEVAHMKAKNIEENSFEIYVEYKNDNEDQFSFYIVEDTLHLVDFSFDKELVDVGVKPSGEAIVHVDVLANELVKHFKSMNETTVNEAPEGMYYIKIPKDAASQNKAQVIFNDLYGIKYEINDAPDGIFMYFKKEDFDPGLEDDLMGDQVKILDTNMPLSEADENKSHDQGGDLDVGHQDDEPDMLKQYAYDIATYASKLYKALDKYDKYDGEVDFPNWWQSKVILARDYISKAQHYLEFEEKQPAIDQLALENTVNEDWGGSDQRAMNQQIHKALGEPTKMPSPFDSKLEYAVQDAVDFHWDDWPEYQTDRQGLYTQAKRAYLRSMFRDTFDKMVRMFEPADEINEDRFLAASMDDLEQVVRNIAHTGGMSEDDAIELAIRKLEAMLDGRDDIEEGFGKTRKAYDLVVNKMKELAKVYKSGDTSVIGQLKDLTAKKKQLEKMLDKEAGDIGAGQDLDPSISENQDIPDVTDMSVVSGGKRYVDMEDMEGEIEIEPGMLVSVKGKVYRVTDIEKGENYLIIPVEQEQINEQATCCGRCGRKHVKGTKCKTPYLKGKDHCRTR